MTATVSPRPMPRRVSADASRRHRTDVSRQLNRRSPSMTAVRSGQAVAAQSSSVTGVSAVKLAAFLSRPVSYGFCGRIEIGECGDESDRAAPRHDAVGPCCWRPTNHVSEQESESRSWKFAASAHATLPWSPDWRIGATAARRITIAEHVWRFRPNDRRRPSQGCVLLRSGPAVQVRRRLTFSPVKPEFDGATASPDTGSGIERSTDGRDPR